MIKMIIKNCKFCNKEFDSPKFRNRKFCSHICALKSPISPETRMRLSKARKGITPKNFIEIQKKSWIVSRGRKLSEEHKKKISEGIRKSDKFYASMRTQEHRQKMSEIFKRTPRAVGPKHGNWKGGNWANLDFRKSYTQFNNRRQKLRRKNVLGSHTQEEWENLKIKYQHICLCCKQQEPFITLSVDHIMPIILGGTNDISNIQPLCRTCNSIKNAKYINYIELYESRTQK